MERAARIVTLGLLALTACGTSAYGSKAKSASSSKGGSKGVVFPADPNATPAVGYANLDRASCEAELQSRSISYVPVASAIGVMAPVRLNGPLHGITFHSGLPAKQRATSPYEIMDCRLVLALDDFSQILARYDVADVTHFSAYRPPPKNWPANKPGERHGAAMALDAAIFTKHDGTKLNIEKDFHGAIGSKTCGGAGPWPATAEAKDLRNIACDTADAHLFNVELTPDFNAKHKNHFHLEVTPGAKWFLVK
ncbi:MAG TPA: extensin family protein [Polyangiaceae bacterium]